MRNFLLLLVFLVFVSCSGDAVKRLTPVQDEPSEAGEDVNDENIENPENPDDAVVLPDENGGEDEVQDEEKPETDDETPVTDNETPVTDNETPEIPDSEEVPVNDETPETPDEDEDSESELPDIEYPECGIAFDGSNCSSAYCHTIDDCCEGDVCVATDGCGGHKVCRTAFFKENFDSYVAGNFPDANWTLKYRGAGKQYQIITSERYVSAENSMHLLGTKSGNLSAIMTAALPQVPDVINVEFMMNAQGDDVSLALCSFEREAPGQNWGDMYLKIEFANGKIRYQIPEWTVYEVAPSYEANQWYKLRIKMNQPAKTVSVWVNGELKVENQAFNLDSWSIPNICLASNKQDKKVWFDDIFVWGE